MANMREDKEQGSTTTIGRPRPKSRQATTPMPKRTRSNRNAVGGETMLDKPEKTEYELALEQLQAEKERKRKSRMQAEVQRLTAEGQLSEDHRRRIGIDRDLGDLRNVISDAAYQQLLENSRKLVPIEDIDNENMLYEERQALLDQGMSPEEIDKYQGEAAKKWFGLRNSMTAPRTPEEYAEFMNDPKTREQLRKLNEEQGKKYGRDFSAGFVDKVRGFEGRASTYIEAEKKAMEEGVYPEGFDDSVFDGGIAKMRKFQPISLMEDWQVKQQTRALASEFEQFEQAKQQLTQNYQRMDPFARVQFREMEKLYNKHYRAYVQGHYDPLTYLRKQAQLAEGMKAIRWDYHMKAPGGAPGDIISPQENGAMYQRQADGSLKAHHLTPEFVSQNTQQLGENMWLVPTIKNGEIVNEKIEMKDKPGPDWKEKKEWMDKFEKKEEQFREQAAKLMEEGDERFRDQSDIDEWAREMATRVLGDYKDAVDAMADPQARNPNADPDDFIQQKHELEDEAAFQEGKLDAKQRAMQQFRQMRTARLMREEAVMGAQKVAERRTKGFKEVQQAVFDEQYAQEMEEATQQYDAEMEGWRQDPRNAEYEQWMLNNMFTPPHQRPPAPTPSSPPPVLPGQYVKRKQAQSPSKAFESRVEAIRKEIDSAAGDGQGEFMHAINMLGQDDKAFKYLIDNPIPVTGETKGRKAEQIPNGYVYLIPNRANQLAKFYKHKGRYYQISEYEGVPISQDRGELSEAVQGRVQAEQVQKAAAGGSEVSRVSDGSEYGASGWGAPAPETEKQGQTALDKAWDKYAGMF